MSWEKSKFFTVVVHLRGLVGVAALAFFSKDCFKLLFFLAKTILSLSKHLKGVVPQDVLEGFAPQIPFGLNPVNHSRAQPGP